MRRALIATIVMVVFGFLPSAGLQAEESAETTAVVEGDQLRECVFSDARQNSIYSDAVGSMSLSPKVNQAVGDDMVYTVEYPQEGADLQDEAGNGNAVFWIEGYDGTKYYLSQEQSAEGKTILRLDGKIPSGSYVLLGATRKSDGLRKRYTERKSRKARDIDEIVLDPAFEVMSPNAASFSGEIAPGAVLTISGQYFSKTPRVLLRYQDESSGQAVVVECASKLANSSYDDPYDDTAENFPMNVETGESELLVEVPDTVPANLSQPRLMVESDNGWSVLLAADQTSDTLLSRDQAAGEIAEEQSQRGSIVSYSLRSTFRAKDEAYISAGSPKWRKVIYNPPLRYLENIMDGFLAKLGFSYLISRSKMRGTYTHDISLYNVVYRTVDEHGCGQEGSGVVILPKYREQPVLSHAPMLSLQHGTMLMKAHAPSMADGPELAYAACFASIDYYIAVVPDHPGLGAAAYKNKQYYHPYCQAKPIALNNADMIRMAPNLIKELNELSGFKKLNDGGVQPKYPSPDGRLFLVGYSEGGYATMALLRELTENRQQYGIMSVAGVAAMAGPYSLSSVMVSKLMEDKAFPVFYFAPYLTVTLNTAYKLYADPSEYFATPYKDLPSYIDGYHTDKEVDRFKPPSGKPRDIFTAEVQQEMQLGQGKILKALRSNDLDTDWGQKAITTNVLLAHAGDDDCVPFENSRRMQAAPIWYDTPKLVNLTEALGIFKNDEDRTWHLLYFPFAMGEAWDWMHKLLEQGAL